MSQVRYPQAFLAAAATVASGAPEGHEGQR
jgi:hypothetical protein